MGRKGLFSFVLSIIMLFELVPLFAGAYFAESMDIERYGASDVMPAFEADIASVTDIESFRRVILEAASECVEKADISSFALPFNLVDSVTQLIWYNMPEVFNLKSIAFTYDERTNLVETVIFKYFGFADTKEEYEKCHRELILAANRILAGIEGNEKLTDVQKALLLHDRLAVRTEYDYDFYVLSEMKHTAYGALVNRSSVCQGYTMAYMYLLDRVGIKNYYCSSEELNHSWNIVYIDKKSYHVDVTWDDVSWDLYERGIAGMVRHDNFLRSTEGFFEEGHTAADYDMSPSDTTYDDYFWQNSESEFQLIGNDIYYIDNNNGFIREYGKDKKIQDVSDIWRVDQSHYWLGNYSRLSSAGGDLLYSLSDGIYKYSLKTGTADKIYSPVLTDNCSVYGFTYEDSNLIVDINDGPPFSQNGTEKLTQVKVPYISENLSVPENIKIMTAPSKTIYYPDDSLDTTGLSLIVTYSDKSSKTVTTGFNCSGFSTDSFGTKTVYVHYAGFTDSFEITVVCLHKNTEIHPEIPATTQKTGLTQGVFCTDCSEYISGREELPVIDPSFTSSENMIIVGNCIIIKSPMTASQLLSQAAAGSYIKRPDGNAADEMADIPTTGWIMVLPGENEMFIAVRGDINGDCEITASDARIALRASVGLEYYSKSSPAYKAADVEGNDGITAADARVILRASVGLEDILL